LASLQTARGELIDSDLLGLLGIFMPVNIADGIWETDAAI
jgi:hypothetical protein